MKSRNLLAGFAVVAALLVIPPMAYSNEIVVYMQGGILPNAPSYDWYYGCAPTSAGMMMGYYDINGYGSLSYDNLVPGGQAELSTWAPGGSPLVEAIIASPGHIADFYGGESTATRGDVNNLNSGDDVEQPWHEFDSLADFMGTSQDSLGHEDGVTAFAYYENGWPFTAQDALDYDYWDSDGMYGLWEYVQYAGYNVPRANFFTQRIYSSAAPYGFTFQDYMSYIDMGAVVMIQLEDHSMFGYGYGANNSINFYNTWDSSPHEMVWGGTYSGQAQLAVTVFTLPGGGTAIPEPGTLLLLGSGILGLICFRKRFRR